MLPRFKRVIISAGVISMLGLGVGANVMHPTFREAKFTIHA
jgi:hypothetical protein